MSTLDKVYYAALAIIIGLFLCVVFIITFPQGNLYGIFGAFCGSYGFTTLVIMHMVQKIKRIKKNSKNE